MHTLEITGLTVDATIGVHAYEQKILQPLLIDISLKLEADNIPDDINHTLDYDKLCQTITQFIKSRPFQLIETVVNEVVSLLKTEFQITPIKVSVSKPNAIKNARNISVIFHA